MEESEIRPNTEYAFREKRSSGTPLERVRVIEHVRRNKWKVQWIDPNPGLVDYVETKQLMVQWKDRKAFLQEDRAPSDSVITMNDTDIAATILL